MKTSKTLEIKVKDPLCHHELSPLLDHLTCETVHLHPVIDPTDIPNIINNVGEVSEDDLQEAINKIIVYMAKDRIDEMTVNLDHRDQCYAPAKKMTIAEIEKELGYKVKIVKDEEE